MEGNLIFVHFSVFFFLIKIIIASGALLDFFFYKSSPLPFIFSVEEIFKFSLSSLKQIRNEMCLDTRRFLLTDVLRGTSVSCLVTALEAFRVFGVIEI